MVYTATLTSKKQLTIPAQIFYQLNLKEGQKVIVSEKNGSIMIEPSLALIDRLAGSVKIPKEFRGLSPDEMIKKAREEHFKK